MISDDDDVCSLGICALAPLFNIELIDTMCAGKTGQKYRKKTKFNANVSFRKTEYTNMPLMPL